MFLKYTTFQIQGELEDLNRPINNKEIDTIIRKLPKSINPGPDGFAS